MQKFSQTAEAVAATTKKLEKISFVAELLHTRPAEEAALSALYLSGHVFPAWDERTLQVGGSLLWHAIAVISDKSDAELSSGYRTHGDLGAAAQKLLAETAPQESALSVQQISGAFDALAAARGLAAKGHLIRELLARATALEAKYIIKIITGDMRIGLKESLVEEAISKAFEVPLAEVKRANMLLGDVAETVRMANAGRLSEARMKLFHPIGFMLATPAEDAESAFEQFTEFIVEDKYDGIRAQAHVQPSSLESSKVKIYSRTLDEISGSFPELVPSLAGFADEVVLDGEILAWRDGRAMAFSQLQKRLGRKRITEHITQEIPIAYVAFDLLALNGELVIELPLTERRKLLTDIFGRLQPPALGDATQTMFPVRANDAPPAQRVIAAPSVIAQSAAHLDELFEAAQARGNEGLMIKDANSAYMPGRRGQSWLKLKRELATLDVVVTAVEFGNGKRARLLSDYTFAVRAGGSLVNIGKAYTGLTDAEIADMTEWFKQHTIADHGHSRTVEPKIVIEVAFNAVMRSDRHNSGFALRFPRIVRLRPDKPVDEIDTLERAEQIYSQQVHMKTPA